MTDAFREIISREEALQRPDLVPLLDRPGVVGPITITRLPGAITSRPSSKRRRLKANVRNPGTQPVTLTLFATGIDQATDDIFKGATETQVDPGSSAELSLDVPDGLIIETGISVTDQDPLDSGILYPGRIRIEDDDLPGANILLAEGAFSLESSLVWPSTARTDAAKKAFLTTELASMAASLTLSLPSGLVGWPVSARCTVVPSLSTSMLTLSTTPISASQPVVLSSISVPALSSSAPASFAPDQPLRETTVLLAASIPGTEGPPCMSVTLERLSSDPYTVISDASVVWAVQPA